MLVQVDKDYAPPDLNDFVGKYISWEEHPSPESSAHRKFVGFCETVILDNPEDTMRSDNDGYSPRLICRRSYVNVVARHDDKWIHWEPEHGLGVFCYGHRLYTVKIITEHEFLMTIL